MFKLMPPPASITRRNFVKNISLATISLPLLSAMGENGSASNQRKPNILFLFPDQWRAQAFSYRGDPNVRTPNLDRLAAEGSEFTRAYSNHPVCSPARSMMMTGLYSHQTGFVGNNFYLEQDPQNLGYQLKDAGYHTGYIGKWHLDGSERPGFVPPERRQGWDDFHGFNRGHWYRLGDEDESRARYFTPSGELVYSEIFEPILQTDLAIDFIVRAKEPWALMVSYGPPHDPYTPPPSHQRHQPDDLQWRSNVPSELQSDTESTIIACGYYGLCELMDEQIGRLLQHLEQTGEAENTYVIFSSDHGDMLASHGRFQKLLPFEESAAVPLIIRGPGIPMGHKESTPVSLLDLPPTLISLAGGIAPDRMQGRDLTPAIQGGSIASEPVLLEGFMFDQNREWRALVNDRYKLVLVVKEGHLVNALYDLQEDPYETRNLYHDPAYQDLVKELTALRSKIASKTGDSFPEPTTPAPKEPPA